MTMQDAVPSLTPTEAATHDDPSAYYAALAMKGFHQDTDLRCWVAPSADTVRTVLSHPALGVRPAAEPVPAALVGTQAGAIFGALVRMNDGPHHTALKAAVQAALDALPLPDLLGRAAVVAQHLAAQLPTPLSGPALTRFSYTLPSAVLADAYGFTLDSWPAIADEVLRFVRCIAPGGTADEIAAGITAAEQLSARLEAQMVTPGPLLARLVAEIEKTGLPETPQWVVANAIGLFFQACEGCAGLIGQAILLCESTDPAIESATLVDTILRDSPPIQNTRRFVAEDTTIAGCPFHRGDTVLAILSTRNAESPQGLAFGHGAHACPGSRWAKAIAVAGVDQLRRIGVSEPVLAQRAWRRSPNARVPEFNAGI